MMSGHNPMKGAKAETHDLGVENTKAQHEAGDAGATRRARADSKIR